MRARFVWDIDAMDWVLPAERKPRVQTVSNVIRLPHPSKRTKRGRFIWHKGDWLQVTEPKRASGVQIVSDISAYRSPVCDANGKHPVIDGRSAQREDLKRNGCRIKEPSERLSVAGPAKLPEPVITRAMERTAVETYERAMSRD